MQTVQNLFWWGWGSVLIKPGGLAFWRILPSPSWTSTVCPVCCNIWLLVSCLHCQQREKRLLNPIRCPGTTCSKCLQTRNATFGHPSVRKASVVFVKAWYSDEDLPDLGYGLHHNFETIGCLAEGACYDRATTHFKRVWSTLTICIVPCTALKVRWIFVQGIQFLPAAKLTGHRTVRVVVVGGGGLLWGHDLKSQDHFFWWRSTSLFFSILFSHPKFPSGWDPGLFHRISLRGGIRRSLIRLLFGVGSVSSSQIFLRGGIQGFF